MVQTHQCSHTARLWPAIDRSWHYSAVRSAELGNRDTFFGLLEDRQYLAVCIAGFFMWNPIYLGYKKFYFWPSLISGGIIIVAVISMNTSTVARRQEEITPDEIETCIPCALKTVGSTPDFM